MIFTKKMKPKIENLVNDKTPTQKVLILINGQEKTLDFAQLLENFRVEGLIRIPASEYENIDIASGILGHFNLEKTNHRIGNKYLVLKIQRHGTYATETEAEQPPLLSLDEAFIAECIRVENNLPYDALTREHFEHSMRGLNDRESLLAVMQNRYRSSRPNLSAEEILAKGVGFTLLRIIKKVNL